jgi:hypothetical protein
MMQAIEKFFMADRVEGVRLIAFMKAATGDRFFRFRVRIYGFLPDSATVLSKVYTMIWPPE